MKFIKLTPETSDTRIIKKFAILPITIRSFRRKETRWLEYVYVKQIYCCYYDSYPSWDDVQFVTEKEYQKWQQQKSLPF